MKKKPLKRSQKPLKRSTLRRISERRGKELKEYMKAKKDYFEVLRIKQGLPEGQSPWCELYGEPHVAVDIHHVHARGQGGKLIAPESWKAVCRAVHEFIHSHPKEAREKGWLI